VMSNRRSYRELETKIKEAEDLFHALRTQQVDAIVGHRHIMLVRLKRAEENLKASRNQLRALAAHLLSGREDERASIARELHDEFGQALTSLHLGISWISRKLTPGHQPLQKKLKSLSAITTRLIRTTKNIAGELRIGVLDELGLVRTLKAEVREFESQTGIRCSFKTNAAKVRFDRSAEVAIFRIVQAALTNVVRHAHASRVLVALTETQNGLILVVKDNGKGISKKSILGNNSLGITGMRERTLVLGGTFTVKGSKSKGTVLTSEIPLSRATIGARFLTKSRV
jgi:two-component system, NarL family, sensor histidine kinase UhpB